ncbi:MAG: dTDP-4-amino-4,6-dideoxygalactose transaminase [Bacteroidota bacterium]
MKIPFFKTTIVGEESKYLYQLLSGQDSFAEKHFVSECEKWFKDNHQLENFYLTKSCTDSLELAALVLDIQEGDEVILPSYSFVSCGSAFALRGATCVYVDIHPDTMNVDESKIEAAITPRTKAILTVNYASVGCNYEAIRVIAAKNDLFIIEDNAHGILAEYRRGECLGTFGDISTFSFDHLKNISCGQGGGIAVNNESLLKDFFVHYEFGTNRRSFFKGDTDRYEWKNIGSNYPLSELNAAMLFAQLESAKKINTKFVYLMDLYNTHLSDLKELGKISFPLAAHDCKHNGHCFFIKAHDSDERSSLMKFLQSKEINAQFHYTPLHSSEYGKIAGRFSGEDVYTTIESARLLRLPLFYAMTDDELNFVTDSVKEFYRA